jgi:hypothetical protein
MTQLHECTVCGLLDQDFRLKQCSYCPVCDAWICISDITDIVRRTLAMVKRKKNQLHKIFDRFSRNSFKEQSKEQSKEQNIKFMGGLGYDDGFSFVEEFGEGYFPAPPPAVASGVITAGAGNSLASDIVQQTGVNIGDLIFAFSSYQATSASSISGDNCSSQGSLPGSTNSSGDTVGNVGCWCIASATTVTFTATDHTTSDQRAVTQPFSSTTAWTTASILTATSFVADANPVIGPQVSPTNANSVVVGFMAQEAVAETLTQSGPWIIGQNDGGHVDVLVYRINVGAGNYSPAVSRNTPAPGWVAITASMSD